AICKDATVILDANGHGTLSVSDVDNGSYDLCGPVTVGISNDEFSCEDIGSTTVILTATDASGNSSICAATVTVLDLTPPTAICKPVTIELDANGSASITESDIDGGSFDGCSDVNLSASKTSFNCSNLGGNPVILTVTDGSGNSSACTANVT